MVKKYVILFIGINISCHAQHVVFQWGNTPWGLVFEDTNLVSQVKDIIGKDVEYIFSSIHPTNATLNAGNIHYHQSGVILFPEKFYPSGYQMTNSMNCFLIGTSVSSNYLAKIALTNSHPQMVGSLSNFLTQISAKTSSNTTDSAFTDMRWSLEKNAKMSMDDWGERNIKGQKEESLDVIYRFPSLLDFKVIEETGGSVLVCAMRSVSPKSNPEKIELGDIFVFASNQWYFADWQF